MLYCFYLYFCPFLLSCGAAEDLFSKFNVGDSVDGDNKVLKWIELNRTESYSGDTRVFNEFPKMPQRASHTPAFHPLLMGLRMSHVKADEREKKKKKKNAPDVETAWIATINTFSRQQDRSCRAGFFTTAAKWPLVTFLAF